jgi:hypothetical protein
MILKIHSYSCIKCWKNNDILVFRSLSWDKDESRSLFSKTDYCFSHHWSKESFLSAWLAYFSSYNWNSSI